MEKLCCFVSVSCLRHFVRPILPRVHDPHKPQASERKLHFFFEKLLPGCVVGQQFCFPPYSLQAIYVPVKLKLQHPPRANLGHLTVHRAWEGGNLNVALEGWEIWTRFISSSSVICPWVFSVFAGFDGFVEASIWLVHHILTTDVLSEMSRAKVGGRIRQFLFAPTPLPAPTISQGNSKCEVHGLGLMWILDPWENGPNKMAVARNTDKTAKLLHLSLFSSCSHFVQQMNDSLDLLKPAKLVQYRQRTII